MDQEKQTLVRSDDSVKSDDSLKSDDSVKSDDCKIKKRINKRILVSIILLFILLVLLILVLINYSIEGGISASSRYYRYTCSATDYGCCEIYTQCKSNKNTVDYKIEKIMDGIIAHDSSKSNCPSLERLINRYNDHYGSEDCGEYGCCSSFDIGCDKTIRDSYSLGNNKETIDRLYNNSETITLKIPKNKEGTNCFSKTAYMTDIIIKYEDNYPKNESTISEFFTILFTTAVVLCLLKCIS